jgi:CDP-glycerol glycerophosphotransferase (TagB/SpsB family)
VLSATNNVPDFFPGIKVQIFHGFSINKRSSEKGHFRIRGGFDLYCTQGPSTTAIFQRIASKLCYFEVQETGWSKVDPLFPLKKNNNPRPKILISSTFTPRLSLAHNPYFFDEIKKLIKLDNYDWMITMHPLMEITYKNMFKSLACHNVTFEDTTDLIPLFQQADIMIADTTSAIAEFLLQKKPVVTFNNNRPECHLIDIKKPENLSNAITQALNPSKELIANIETYVADTHPYNDGKSCSRVIEACIGFLHKDKKHLKAKPFNFIRKLKIRKQYNFFTFRSYTKPLTIK